jgi:hypothetical protein
VRPASGKAKKCDSDDRHDDGPSCQSNASPTAIVPSRWYASNENKMSDGGRKRVSLGVEVRKSFQKWSGQRSAVRSIAWLDAFDFAEECTSEGRARTSAAPTPLVVQQRTQ